MTVRRGRAAHCARNIEQGELHAVVFTSSHPDGEPEANPALGHRDHGVCELTLVVGRQPVPTVGRAPISIIQVLYWIAFSALLAFSWWRSRGILHPHFMFCIIMFVLASDQPKSKKYQSSNSECSTNLRTYPCLVSSAYMRSRSGV